MEPSTAIFCPNRTPNKDCLVAGEATSKHKVQSKSAAKAHKDILTHRVIAILDTRKQSSVIHLIFYLHLINGVSPETRMPPGAARIVPSSVLILMILPFFDFSRRVHPSAKDSPYFTIATVKKHAKSCSKKHVKYTPNSDFSKAQNYTK
jgi:hypothetical protein